jgi:hypothetical protein
VILSLVCRIRKLAGEHRNIGHFIWFLQNSLTSSKLLESGVVTRHICGCRGEFLVIHARRLRVLEAVSYVNSLIDQIVALNRAELR